MRILDAFAGRGGATAGYKARGHQVVAVDINDYSAQNPADDFVVADAVDFIRDQGHRFDFIHMSAPCQFWTRGNASKRAGGTNQHPRLIAAARHAALSTGRPFVIENVEDAAAELRDPILLCGRMFGLSATDTDGTPLIMDRHRLFEFGNMDRPLGLTYAYRTTDTALNDDRAIAKGKRRASPARYRAARAAEAARKAKT